MGEEQGYLPYPDFETLCIHHTERVNQKTNENISTPIVFSNFYEHKEKGRLSKYSPGRLGNPTRSILENLIALMNKAKYGLCFSSGVGAIMAAVSLLKQGDRILCSDDIYGGTTQLLLEVAPRFGICTCHLDLTNLSNLEQAITPKTKLIWTENPTNPKQKVIDLRSLAKIAKEKDILVVTDNTFLSPYLQRPTELGIDISLLSLTKYMNGHSDVIMGAVCTNRKDLYKKLKYIQTNFGHVPCPFDVYQVLRGLKTLPMRMKKHQFNSMEIAKYLESHPKIESVLHPGLPSHPQYELFKSQTSGYSGMVSFYLKGGEDESLRFMNGLHYFTQAVSLGGYESLVEMPLLNSHHNIPEELQKRMQYTGNLIRMSVGLENVCDLINDLENSLQNM